MGLAGEVEVAGMEEATVVVAEMVVGAVGEMAEGEMGVGVTVGARAEAVAVGMGARVAGMVGAGGVGGVAGVLRAVA